MGRAVARMYLFFKFSFLNAIFWILQKRLIHIRIRTLKKIKCWKAPTRQIELARSIINIMYLLFTTKKCHPNNLIQKFNPNTRSTNSSTCSPMVCRDHRITVLVGDRFRAWKASNQTQAISTNVLLLHPTQYLGYMVPVTVPRYRASGTVLQPNCIRHIYLSYCIRAQYFPYCIRHSASQYCIRRSTSLYCDDGVICGYTVSASWVFLASTYSSNRI